MTCDLQIQIARAVRYMSRRALWNDWRIAIYTSMSIAQVRAYITLAKEIDG